MASERRSQVVRLAEILGVEFERSMGTAELMEMCIVECDGRSANWGQEPDESESDEDAPPPGMREALRSVPHALPAAREEPAPASSGSKHRAGGNGARKLRKAAERFESEQAQAQRFDRERPVTGSVRASNGATLHGVGVEPTAREGASLHVQEDGRTLEVPPGVTLAQAREALGLRQARVTASGSEAQDCPEDATDEGGIEPAVRHTRRDKRRGRQAA